MQLTHGQTRDKQAYVMNIKVQLCPFLGYSNSMLKLTAEVTKIGDFL